MQPSIRSCFSALFVSSHFPMPRSPAVQSRMVCCHSLMKILVALPFYLPLYLPQVQKKCWRKMNPRSPLYSLKLRISEHVRIVSNGHGSLPVQARAKQAGDAAPLGLKQQLLHAIARIAHDDVSRYTREKPV